jgi:hypothetical protein
MRDQSMHRPVISLWLGVILLVLLSATSGLHAESRFVRNGSLNQKGGVKPYFTQETVDGYRKQGWTCPDAESWPAWWSGIGPNMTLVWSPTGGKSNDGYLSISGKDGLVCVYHGLPLESYNVMTFWVKGKGSIRAGLLGYKVENGQTFGGVPVPALTVKVDSPQWVRYRHLFSNEHQLNSVHPAFTVPEGTIDLDEVDIESINPAMAMIIAEENTLYGAGTLVENRDTVPVDQACAQRVTEYTGAVKAFRAQSAKIEARLHGVLDEQITALDADVLAKDVNTIPAFRYNDMLVLTRLLKRLSEEADTAARPVTATSTSATRGYKPGERAARPDTVTITDIHSNKVRYDENEQATTVVSVINTSGTERKGTLVALLHTDLDTVREVGRKEVSLGWGQQTSWPVTYSVGPETYGRALEVRFIDEAGTVVDSWQEFYAVAAEWFRVQQHTHGAQSPAYRVDPWVTYVNQMHYFASEPTDFGVRMTDTETYISGQPLYHMDMPARKAMIAHYRKFGINFTFYQNISVCGQMGYKVLQDHPEYALYDPNGQFAVDPIYGGYPNPMELASPMEIGPKRKVVKPYLDRKLTNWGHTMTNTANEDVVRYMAECIHAYAKELGATGIYVDGNLGVFPGYNVDGSRNVKEDTMEEYARLSARNHRLYSDIVKQDNPLFGTWFNWSYQGNVYFMNQGYKLTAGSGVPGDVSDEAIRSIYSYKNVMTLAEYQHSLIGSEGPDGTPIGFLEGLLLERDDVIQKYGGNKIMGYFGISPVDKDDPGPSNWGWPTLNYFGAQMIATQFHFVSFFRPSMRPTLQFQTRYSRFLWAPDIKALPATQQVVKVTSLEEDIWWNRTVYRCERAGGYDLIVHLVRIPPTKRWDLEWTLEPDPLEGVTLEANIGQGTVQTVHAMRPFYYEEEQQPVQTVLHPTVKDGVLRVDVPSFRYHTMLVIRVKK